MAGSSSARHCRCKFSNDHAAAHSANFRIVRWRTDEMVPEGLGVDRASSRTPWAIGQVCMSTLPPLSSHRICIVMSADGRRLRCRDCLLSFSFPFGAQYDEVAKEFQMHECRFPSRIPPHADIVTARKETDRHLVMLRYEGRVAVMASCARCELKFFVPTTLSRDALEAEAYLVQRFAAHRCEVPTR